MWSYNSFKDKGRLYYIRASLPLGLMFASSEGDGYVIVIIPHTPPPPPQTHTHQACQPLISPLPYKDEPQLLRFMCFKGHRSWLGCTFHICTTKKKNPKTTGKSNKWRGGKFRPFLFSTQPRLCRAELTAPLQLIHPRLQLGGAISSSSSSCRVVDPPLPPPPSPSQHHVG